jgi:prepilin-type N-terminal cleavage/methylation domain-containing protein
MSRFRRRLPVRGERGYSLIEMLVVLVILSVVMEALTTLFVRASNAESAMNNRFQAQEHARVALDKLRREIHCASSATPAATATSTITLTLPSYCKTGSGSITWCTRSVSTNRYALYRVVGATCSGGIKWADYLTVANAFNFTTQTTSSLALLHVDLNVNVNPRRGVDGYELVDDIVLRNSSRS